MSIEPAGQPRELKILVVDDDRDGAESLAILLQLSGHQVRLAYDGKQALTIAREFIPNVALIDLGLPMMNGFEVARLIRQEPALNTTVLVALTGYGREDDKRESVKAGFDHHLVKPTDFNALEQVLQTVADSEQADNSRTPN
ncbi:MAG: response regulator [Candidatus Binataceae bacterium]|nr:response regulator [Candidatus Binataceae bacterium]